LDNSGFPRRKVGEKEWTFSGVPTIIELSTGKRCVAMKHIEKEKIEGKIRLRFDFVLEADVRKVLTLEQMFTVFRRTFRPEQLTGEQRRESSLNFDSFTETSYMTRFGQWNKQGISGSYYLDDAVEHNEDGTLTVGLFWLELEGEYPQAEQWFEEIVQALLDAEENLLLFGRI
jgi:hypothetical protein